MPLEHLVLFKLRELSAEEEKALIAKAASFEKEIPGVLEVAFGKNITPRGKGYTHGLRVLMESAEILASYGPSKPHQEFVAMIKPVWNTEAEAEVSVLAVDFEVPARQK